VRIPQPATGRFRRISSRAERKKDSAVNPAVIHWCLLGVNAWSLLSKTGWRLRRQRVAPAMPTAVTRTLMWVGNFARGGYIARAGAGVGS
jgi:hypothetical protein